ncbi:MAG: M67 family metallopeptidase [Chloroflexi bacterium]|nr:M67 family metallopeptidase [Chloroflexota bacterium]
MGFGTLFIAMQSLSLSKEQLQEMTAYVHAHAPLEACGLLAGKNSQVEKIFFVQNQAQSPVRYVMDPIDQLHAFEWIESNDMDLLGIFHSHPAGPETVSPTDIAEAAYAVTYVILACVDSEWRTRGFWIENGEFREVSLQVNE